MKYCEYCETENSTDAVFCNKCGANLNYSAVKEGYNTIEHSKNKKSRSKTKKVIKKVKAKKEKRRKKENQEVVRKMSLFQKIMMFFLIILVLLLSGVILGYLYYNYYEKEVTVPNVVGMTYSQAEKTLKDAELKVTKVDQMTTDEKETGIVLKQSIKEQTKISKKTKIKLEVGVLDQEYLVPNFIGMTMKRAIVLLNESSIEYKITMAGNSTVTGLEDGMIEEQSITPGTKMKKTEMIVFTISEINEETPRPTLEPISTPIVPIEKN